MPKEFNPREMREFMERETSEHFPFQEHSNHVHPHLPHHHDFQHSWGDDDDDNNPLVQLLGFLGDLFS